MLLEGKVGAPSSALGAGVEHPVRVTDRGGLGTADVAAKWYSLVNEGNVFRGQTAAAGVAPGTSAGTTAAFSLYNRVGSGVKLVVLEFSMGYVSGTLGAGYIAITANTNLNAAATTGTAITAVNADLSGATGAVGQPLTTATIPATPTLIGPLFGLGASLASTAVAPWHVSREIGGSIVVSPGATVSLQGIAAGGSSPLVAFGAVWQEVPV